MGNGDVSASEIMQLADVIGLKEYINELPNGLDTVLEPTGKGLSTIIAKKVLLLRTIVNRPSLLLLDEPFELAGAESSKNISNYLLTLKDITTVVITGYIPFAKNADIVIWMDHGKILHIGAPADVFNKLNIA
jgi:ABC-type multidrug transport system fused ATPase/permease subunit